jgi:GAF domain-containing protein
MGDAVDHPQVRAMVKRLVASGVVATLVVPMLVGGKVVGFLSVRFREKHVFASEELELIRALAHQAMLAIQLLRLSRQSLQAAVVAERNRMARDIHDTLA